MPFLFSLWVLLFSLPAIAQETIIAEDSEDTVIEEPAPVQKTYSGIRFRGLNKVTTKVEDIDAVMGAVTRFGNLEIIPRGCWVAPPNKRPEQAGLMEVWYWKQGEKPSLVFFGWMFASSPALSSLEHPIYDITMLECIEKIEEKNLPADEKTEAQPAADEATEAETEAADETSEEATPATEETEPTAAE